MWFNESNETQTTVVSLKPARSGKGWILQGKTFDVFLWQSSKTLEYLLEACVLWASEGLAPTITIIKDSTVKEGYRLVPGEPGVEFTQGTGSYHWKTPESSDSENPFLVKKTPPPSPTTGSTRKR